MLIASGAVSSDNLTAVVDVDAESSLMSYEEALRVTDHAAPGKRKLLDSALDVAVTNSTYKKIRVRGTSSLQGTSKAVTSVSTLSFSHRAILF